MIDKESILEKLKEQDIGAFKELCLAFLEPLEEYAFSILNDAKKAREMTDDTVGRVWATNGFSKASLPLLEFLKEEIRKSILSIGKIK